MPNSVTQLLWRLVWRPYPFSTKQNLTLPKSQDPLYPIMETEKLFLLFSLLMLHFSSCTSLDSLKTNQTIKEGDVLISEGNNFALGFFSPGSSSNRYLGIWYHKVPEQTVVWVANRNDPITGSSGFLFINQYGNLVLYGNDDQKLPVWSTNVSEA